VVIVVFTDEVADIDLASLLVVGCVVPGKHVHDDELAVPVRRVFPRFRVRKPRDVDAVPDSGVEALFLLVGGRGD